MKLLKTTAFCALVLLLALLASPSGAQNEAAAQTSAGTARMGSDENPIEINADQLEYEADKKLLTGRGNVVLKQGPDVLRGDFMTVRTDTHEARAMGNVVFEREGKVWRGEDITYNFRTREGDFGEFEAFSDPFYVRSRDSERTAEGDFILKGATITTCEGDHPEFKIRAAHVRIHGETMTGYNAIFILWGWLPIFYVPMWKKNLAGDKTNVDIVPGYSSRMGGFLLTAYNYRLNDWLTASTHLDYRSRRGVGVGQDFQWGSPDIDFRGLVTGYYTSDDDPLRKRTKKEKEDLEDLVDNDRYRFRLFDYHSISPRDYLVTELNYLSDPAVLEDFFSEEYRNNVQPENRVSLIHRGDKFTAGLQLNMRLNDFYDNVNRLPEASLSISRLRLGQTPFYYESQNSAAFLERVYEEGSDDEDYDAFRIDSLHTIYYPKKYFAFLNIIPRAGYRATYYSKTFEESTVTNVISTVDSNGVTHITNEVDNLTTEMGSDLRSVYELGVEVSFKAFKVLHDEWISRDDQGLRHIVEPYARHTYIPEPNLVPDQLPQFDYIDKIDETHNVRVGVRNKLQTKRRKSVHDLVDLNVWSTYRIKRDDDEEPFGDIYWDSELRLVDWLMVDFDGSYDHVEGEVSGFTTQVAFTSPEETRLSAEYRYQRDRREQVAGEVVLFPNWAWSVSGYGRFNIQDSQMDEQSYFLQHKGACLGWGLGYRQIFREDEEDDITVWLRLWLLAFPKSSISLGG